MGVVKDQIDKIRIPFLRALIRPVYLLLVRFYVYVRKFGEIRIIKATHKRHALLQQNYKQRKQKQVKVLFLVLNASIWKYDILFKKMLADDSFEPLLFICPLKQLSSEDQLDEIDRIYAQFAQRGFPIQRPFNEYGELIDIKNEFQPDFVFFTNPHELSHDIYSITNFNNSLSAYAPYSIMATNKPLLQYDKLFHNLLWRLYNETPIHQQMAKKYARVKGSNATVAGSSILEALNHSKTNKTAWQNSGNQKKIIYAPHHTFNDLEELNFSTIIENGWFMLEMAKKYEQQIHIAFKPHPLLKTKLYKYPLWGKEKTDAFYSEWDTLSNTQIELGDYIDLFQQSDAMILDSISFITEYLFVDKPSLFLFNKEINFKAFNTYGKASLACLEWANSHHEIEGFIQCVIREVDKLQNKRNQFLQQNYPKNQLTFSDFVIRDIKQVFN